MKCPLDPCLPVLCINDHFLLLTSELRPPPVTGLTKLCSSSLVPCNKPSQNLQHQTRIYFSCLCGMSGSSALRGVDWGHACSHTQLGALPRGLLFFSVWPLTLRGGRTPFQRWLLVSKKASPEGTSPMYKWFSSLCWNHASSCPIGQSQ